MKVNNKNAKVELPIEPANKLLILISGIKARAAKHNMLGQSIAIVSHNNRIPMKIPKTCIADPDNPVGAGK